MWDDERDTTFFRIISDLFSPAFTLGATALLASYDDETEAVAAPAAQRLFAPFRVLPASREVSRQTSAR